MPAHILDSRLLKDLYGTDEMRAVFDDMHLLQKWLDVEVALAQAEAALGVIPVPAAEEITRRARAENLDTSRIKQLIDQTVHPIVPLIRVLQDACAGDAGEYIHWGATTQDIMDCAVVLQVRDALALIEKDLDAIRAILVRQAKRYRDTPMAGRTHLQQALPVTFGYKIAIWLAMLDRHAERLEQLRPRVLVGQFAGAAGTLASLGERGLEVQKALMEELKLAQPVALNRHGRRAAAKQEAV